MRRLLMSECPTPPERLHALRLRLLGSAQLLRGDEPVQLLERRDAALFALLALQGPTSRARLARFLWPDSDIQRGKNSLRQRLYRLKRVAGCDTVVGDGTLVLAPGLAHDLAVAGAPLANDMADANPCELLGALDYTGCGELEEWVAARRAEWRLARREAMAQTAQMLEAQGRIAQALEFAQRLVREDPIAEHGHRRVMRLHYLRGDRAAALAAFEHCKDLLARELSAAPGPETLALAATIRAGRAGAAGAQAAATPMPVTLLRPPRLVGRDTQWQAIEAGWQAGRLVRVSGEPGIGKSRLLGDFTIAHPGAILTGARPGDSLQSHALLTRLLRVLVARQGLPGPEWVVRELAHLLPELGDAPMGNLQPARLHQAVANALQDWTRQGLTALVLDDLQFADAASLEWLAGWAGQAARDGVALLMAVRAGERPQALVRWLDQIDATAWVDITLAPLDEAGIAQLLDALSIPGLAAEQWVAPLWRHTGGNPMFILETLVALLPARDVGSGVIPVQQQGSLPLPDNVGQLIARRLRQLSPEALRLAQLAALAGPDFSVQLAASVLRTGALDLSTPWAELESAQVLRDNAFAHDLIFEATLRSVPQPIARQMHREIAAATEALGAPPARVARHWFDAAEWERAALASERAAQSALAASRRDEELLLWEQAADCHEKSGHPLGADNAFKARNHAVEAAIVVEPKAATQQRVARLMDAANNDDQRLDANLSLAKLLLTAGQARDARAPAQAALDLALRCGDARRQLQAARLLGVALAVTGEVPAAQALFDTHAAAVAEANSDRDECDFRSDHGFVLALGDRRRQAVAAWQRAANLAETLGDVSDAMVNWSNMSGTLAHLGQLEQALQTTRRADAHRERLGEVGGIPHAANDANTGMLCIALGRYDEALARLTAAQAVFQSGQAATWLAAVENHLANLWLALGQTARAKQCMTALAPEVAVTPRARRLLLLCRIERSTTTPTGRGGGERSVDSARSALALLGANADSVHRLGAQLELAAVLPPEESLALSQAIQAEARACELDSVALHALIREADAHRRCGEHQQAADCARFAVDWKMRCSAHDLQPSGFWWLACQALAASDEAASRAALQQGADWIRQVALPHVPAPFQDSFLHRNPTHRDLLAKAGRELGL